MNELSIMFVLDSEKKKKLSKIKLDCPSLKLCQGMGAQRASFFRVVITKAIHFKQKS